MPSIRLITAAVLLIVATSPDAVTAQTDRGDYVSDASHVLGTYALPEADHSPAAMAAAAGRLLDGLDDDRRRRIAHPLQDDERREWTNLPARRNAGGLRLGDCDRAQVRAACDLMATLFSREGFEKMRDIMLADDQLLRNGVARPGFGTEDFSIVIFGTPSATGPWAFQIDGHHMGVNLAIHGERMTMSPSFIGTQPDAFTIAERRIKPLAGEIDDAFALMGSLSDEQRAKAIVNARRQQIEAGPGHDYRILAARGLSCASLDDAQRKRLLSLIEHWVDLLPPEHAKRRVAFLASEVGRMHFAWSGPTAPGSDVSFVILGPTLIIEYAGQDLGGDPLDHLHTMYRDPTNEYGGQLDEHGEVRHGP